MFTLSTFSFKQERDAANERINLDQRHHEELNVQFRKMTHEFIEAKENMDEEYFALKNQFEAEVKSALREFRTFENDLIEEICGPDPKCQQYSINILNDTGHESDETDQQEELRLQGVKGKHSV